MAPGTAARVHLSLLPCLASLSRPFERLLPSAGRGWRLLAPLARLKVFRELANSVAPSTVPVKFLQWLPSHRECTRLASIPILPNFLPFSNLDPDQTLSSYLGLTSVSRRRMIPGSSSLLHLHFQPAPRLPRFCSLHHPPPQASQLTYKLCFQVNFPGNAEFSKLRYSITPNSPSRSSEGWQSSAFFHRDSHQSWRFQGRRERRVRRMFGHGGTGSCKNQIQPEEGEEEFRILRVRDFSVSSLLFAVQQLVKGWPHAVEKIRGGGFTIE